MFAGKVNSADFSNVKMFFRGIFLYSQNAENSFEMEKCKLSKKKYK